MSSDDLDDPWWPLMSSDDLWWALMTPDDGETLNRLLIKGQVTVAVYFSNPKSFASVLLSRNNVNWFNGVMSWGVTFSWNTWRTV